ncbi:MAG: FKBP-type peptidyl-prolyl cis-trans isomerase [Candidatus Heimdallarchaeota archaeon]|nr:hypothetical protein [Candidatus Heimdallarchaeota archaeon]MCG3257298.1 FKBP-type peptidyl-prolyl cis-trans isomerase [Candidatus Heimdallarchaeota archaeon]MCK4612355.1 FKBP-type peptidyl-prolyl cis-trans isomerase [Candidatus Heimdallarchaeota archaeon]
MKRYALLYMFVVPLIVGLFIASAPTSADKFIVEDGDFLDYGYQLYVNGSLVETRDEENPVQIVIGTTSIIPPGLYQHLIGMRNGEIKDKVDISPDDGFPDGIYAGIALTYYNLQIYKINGYHHTELPTGPPARSFGYWVLTIGGGILGTAGAIFLIYGGYRFYPKIFGKRCMTCKKSALGTCKNCGRAFCDNCYSSGCPNCKGRSLIRFK